MNTQIYEEAANWFVEFRAGDIDPAARRRFDTWIRKSPEHLRAYLEITEIWQDASFVESTEESSATQLVASAKARDPNVIDLRSNDDPREASPPVRHRRITSIRFALAASLVLATLGASIGYWLAAQYHTYATGTGEQRSIDLPDGSTIVLNAQSKVRIHFTDDHRDVDLIRGQALFRVAKDKHRPFLVRSDVAQVRAVGTQFDVYRKTTGTVVSVIEGRVAVLPSDGAPSFSPPYPDDQLVPLSALRERQRIITTIPNEALRQPQSGSERPEQPLASPALETGARGEILLAAGDQITVSPRTAPQVEKDRAATAIAWTQHQLVFRSSPLPDVVEEFNRYNTRRLVIGGADLTSFLVSGLYSSTDPALLVRFLREQPGITIRETETQIVISRARKSSADNESR